MNDEVFEHLSYHDRLFRKSMEYTRPLRQFCEQVLSQEVKELLDLDCITFLKSSYLNDKLRLRAVDLLFSIKFRGKNDVMLILVEHLSSPQKFVPLRLLQYVWTVLEDLVTAKDPKTKKLRYKAEKPLPPIYPVVFYTGHKKYTSSTDIFDLFGPHKELAKKLLQTPFDLIDVNYVSEASLEETTLYETLVRCLRDHRSPKFPEIFKETLQKVDKIATEEEAGYIKAMVQYAAAVGNFANAEGFQEAVRTALTRCQIMEEELMTYGQQLLTEGFKKGKLEGKMEGLKEGRHEREMEIAMSLLADGMALEKVSQFTGLSVKEIQAYQKNTQH